MELDAVPSTDIDDHIHCIYCFQINCNYGACLMQKCPECRIRLHSCKVEDHLLICSKAFVGCPNASLGCPVRLRRERINDHLAHCCASTVFCSVQWNRRILSNFAKRKMKRFAKGLISVETPLDVDPVEVDVCAALVDQDLLVDSYRTKRTDRKHLTDYLNPFHPLMPLRVTLEKQWSFADEDSSDEENRARELQLKKKRSPFENCYLCKQDPSSQHLHVLGNYMEKKEETLDVQPKLKLSPIPPFYESRNLYLDIVCEHFSAFMRKGENMQCYADGMSVYTFCCSDCFRRDEYSNHYELSHMDVDDFICRCPMYTDGCPFFYYKKAPMWGKLRYSRYLSAIVHRPPEHLSTTPSEGKSLCDLPVELIIEILKYLDSGSLRCLSSTNKVLRQICFRAFYTSAMVHIKWEKSESGAWSEKNFMWEFSKCQGRIHEWRTSTTRPMIDHLYNCKFNISENFEPKKIPNLIVLLKKEGKIPEMN